MPRLSYEKTLKVLGVPPLQPGESATVMGQIESLCQQIRDSKLTDADKKKLVELFPTNWDSVKPMKPLSVYRRVRAEFAQKNRLAKAAHRDHARAKTILEQATRAAGSSNNKEPNKNLRKAEQCMQRLAEAVETGPQKDAADLSLEVIHRADRSRVRRATKKSRLELLDTLAVRIGEAEAAGKKLPADRWRLLLGPLLYPLVKGSQTDELDRLAKAPALQKPILQSVLARPELTEKWLVPRMKSEQKGWKPSLTEVLSEAVTSAMHTGGAKKVLKNISANERSAIGPQLAKMISHDQLMKWEWWEDIDFALEVAALFPKDQNPWHTMLSTALREKEYDALAKAVEGGADFNAFNDTGISTAGSNRSLLNQLAENLQRYPPNEIKPLIDALDKRKADILPFDQVKISPLVKTAAANIDKPQIFYGFEAMRTPYVNATDHSSNSQDVVLRMKDIWPLVKLVNNEARLQALKDDLPEGTKTLVNTMKKSPLTGNILEQAKDFLKFVGEGSLLKFDDLDLAESRLMDRHAIVSTRLCKQGLDWMTERGGTVHALLDGVDEKELLEYRDLMKSKAQKAKGEREKKRPTGRVETLKDVAAGLESPLGQKVITYSEIRHMLRNWKKLNEKGKVCFYRKGQPLTAEATKELRKKFETGTLKTAMTVDKLVTVLTRSDDVWGINPTDIDSLKKLLTKDSKDPTFDKVPADLRALLSSPKWKDVPLLDSLPVKTALEESKS